MNGILLCQNFTTLNHIFLSNKCLITIIKQNEVSLVLHFMYYVISWFVSLLLKYTVVKLHLFQHLYFGPRAISIYIKLRQHFMCHIFCAVNSLMSLTPVFLLSLVSPSSFPLTIVTLHAGT